MKGTVKWFSKNKGYGFITAKGVQEDIFVHSSSIKDNGQRVLEQGDEVEFELVDASKGLRAYNVRKASGGNQKRSCQNPEEWHPNPDRSGLY